MVAGEGRLTRGPDSHPQGEAPWAPSEDVKEQLGPLLHMATL